MLAKKLEDTVAIVQEGSEFPSILSRSRLSAPRFPNDDLLSRSHTITLEEYRERELKNASPE